MGIECNIDHWYESSFIYFFPLRTQLRAAGTAKESFGTHTAINPKTGADVVTKKEQNASKVCLALKFYSGRMS